MATAKTKKKPTAKAKKPVRAAGRPVRISARYDSAQTGPQNRNQWSTTDARGPNNANDTATRTVLSRRARNERDNDPHMNGLGKTLAHDLLGTGPRLQLPFEDESLYESARAVEKAFARFCQDIDYAEKLRLLVEPRPYDGETFGQFITNDASPNAVKLDLLVMETEQIATPGFGINGLTMGVVDGIEFDSAGNPTYYHVLKRHPGEWLGWTAEYNRVPASQMVHWFRPSRPGQARGVCEFASSLDIGAQTRRYGKAVLTAAEASACLTGIMKTNTPVDPNSPETSAATMEELSFTPGTFLSLPAEFDASAFKAEQPTGTYKEYVNEKRGEMGRPMLVPFNVISGNSSGYNYSSGRLDHVPYHRIVWIERERLKARVLDKFFRAWYAEAVLAGLIPSNLPDISEWSWDWQWDAFDSIDPVKDAAAWTELLKLKVTTRTEICASRGLRFREVIDQLAAEEDYMRSKGLDPSVEPAPIQPAQPNDPNARGRRLLDDEDTTLETNARYAHA